MSAWAYYNEWEAYPAQWLRNLIAARLIAPGEVDERSIADVRPADLRGFTQCHFFAGIGVWSYALRLAGWHDERPIWTGSCPCQPFSAAGRGAGVADARHLWPAWHALLGEQRPPVIVGEQVGGTAGYAWLDHVFADLEDGGYACATADFPAASVGAPHIRQRLYWVAHAGRGSVRDGRLTLGEKARGVQGEGLQRQRLRHDGGHGRPTDGLADADGRHPGAEREQRSRQQRLLAQGGGIDFVGDSPPRGRRERGDEARAGRGRHADGAVGADGVGDAASVRRDRLRERESGSEEGEGRLREPAGASAADFMGNSSDGGREELRRDGNEQPQDAARGLSATNGFWADAVWLPCRDGKARPVEPGLEPLVTRLAEGMGCDGAGEISSFRTIKDEQGRSIGQSPWRVGMLRAYGNCIVAPQAAEFVRCVMDCLP